MANDPKGQKGRDVGALVRASRTGFDFVATVMGCIALGWFADREMGTAPWGLLGLTLLGFCGGFWHLWRALSGKK